tara:strand:+ start:34 stop:1200 length:1167 start_codon:yes stop_codon:yes gene_type:complete
LKPTTSRYKKTVIPFNKPFFFGDEIANINKVVKQSWQSAHGPFSLEVKNKLNKLISSNSNIFLTPSCTASLEMAALVINCSKNDEVILPSYTFVSTANAFALRGCKLIFADVDPVSLTLTPEIVIPLLSKRTKAIVTVHYGGVDGYSSELRKIADQHGCYLIEDAAQAIGSMDKKGNHLGYAGHMSCFSFHETKNVHCGEGGCLVVNSEDLFERAAIIQEKGTNRHNFLNGVSEKYEWHSLGSSYLMNELSAAYLSAQLDYVYQITEKRSFIWDKYYKQLSKKKFQIITLPPSKQILSNNGHIFYLICSNTQIRKIIMDKLKKEGVMANPHYLALHNSPFMQTEKNKQIVLRTSELLENCLLRLPIWLGVDTDYVISSVTKVLEEIEA